MFQAAIEHFQTMALPVWARSRWINELAQVWQVPDDLLLDRYRLLAEILEYRAVRLDEAALDPLVVSESNPGKEVKRIATLVRAVHASLSSECTGMDAFSLAKSLKKVGLQIVDEIPALIELCSTAEVVEENFYRLRFEHLQGRRDQAVRVLSERGGPMHHRDLLRDIKCQLAPPKRIRRKENLVNQMIGDARIQPIGKTGQWALAEWGLETRSLVEIVEEVLGTAGEALHIDDLTERVLKFRPGAEVSIAMLLGLHPERFRKVAPRIYALTAWGDGARRSEWPQKDDIASFVASFFKSRGVAWVDFGDLQAAFSEKTGLSARSARGILAHHPAVHVERPDHHMRIASYQPNWSNLPSRRRTRTAPLQMDFIVDAAKAKLLNAPTGERPLVEMVKELESELGIGRPNIYAAIDQSEDLEKIAVEKSVFKICRLIGRSFTNFPQLVELRSREWRGECERAVARLTLEDVDVGLFLLGRLFDQAMRYLLESARDRAKMPVLEGHFKRLQNRIDWALSNGIFQDGATLNLLKNERNQRGHQPPTTEERRAIMKFAPFLAGLYIDYLIMIEKRVQQMTETGHL
jgi:hypothetical protein